MKLCYPFRYDEYRDTSKHRKSGRFSVADRATSTDENPPIREQTLSRTRQPTGAQHRVAFYYLCPLAKKQLPPEELEAHLEAVLKGTQKLEDIYRTRANGKTEKIARSYECSQNLKFKASGKTLVWRGAGSSLNPLDFLNLARRI